MVYLKKKKVKKHGAAFLLHKANFCCVISMQLESVDQFVFVLSAEYILKCTVHPYNLTGNRKLQY